MRKSGRRTAGTLLLVFAAGLVFPSVGGYAGSNEVTAQGQPLRWNTVPIRFVINPGGVPGFTGELERLIVAGAVRDGFRAWEQVPNAAIVFNDGGLSSQTTGAFDLVNLVSFQDHSYTFPPGVLAVASTFFSPATGQILDTDILFNPNRAFSPVGTDNAVDIIAVAVHEIGHMLGLGHTGVLSSIMNPFAESGGGVASRAVRPDDAITAAALYPLPTFAPATGVLAGTITTSTGTPVKSAHVIAVSDPGGVPVASQLSGPNGNYRIDGLPPGNYRLFVEPLDGPIRLTEFDIFYSNGQSDFTTSAFGGIGSPVVIPLSAGQSAMANITLPPNPASKLSIELVGAAEGNFVLLTGGAMHLPRSRLYEVIATEATRATDSTFSFSAPGVSRVGPTTGGTFTDGEPFRSQFINIGAGATLASSNLALSNAGSTSAMVGGVVVTVNPLALTPLRDSAGFGTTLSPGSFISIFGNDLAEGLVSATSLPLPTSLGGVSVKIGNRFAPLFFVSPGQINAMVPYEVSGQVSLRVVTGPNAGGNSLPVTLSPTSPGIFATNSAGTGQGSIVHPDGAFVAPVGSIPGAVSRPARRGVDVILIFASGLGRVTPTFPSGLGAGASGTGIPTLVNLPQVRIGGQLAALDFAGLAPTFAGLYQINARVPANAPIGDSVPVQITTFEGQASNTVTIAISQ